MSFGQIVLGILLFALATAVLYVWGLRKSMTQEADLERILLNKCAGTVVKYLRKHGSITQKELPALIQGVKDCLDARELIKLKVLENSMYNAREAATKLAEATGADCVQVIGSKFVLYLQKKKDSAYADLLK